MPDIGRNWDDKRRFGSQDCRGKQFIAGSVGFIAGALTVFGIMVLELILFGR